LSAGYIILGVIAAPFFFLVNMQLENALSISQDASFSDLLYFSYITLTGVGYGDITPVHPIAKSLSLLLGIIGQLYLAVLVGIIIGKYISNGERL
ncbi:MAG: potassium channel family protein, partial [Bacteroidota bacterium]